MIIRWGRRRDELEGMIYPKEGVILVYESYKGTEVLSGRWVMKEKTESFIEEVVKILS